MATGSDFDQALALYDAGQREESATICRRLIAADENDPGPAFLLGVIALDDRRFADAAALFRDGLRIAPDVAEAHNHLGTALANLDRPLEALAHYDRALAADDGFFEAHNNRGSLMLTLGRVEDAIQSFGRAIALNPDYIEARYNLGTALLRASRVHAALDIFDEVVPRAPNFSELHHNRGLAQQRLGRFTDALASFDRALALKPDDTLALDRRGTVLVLINRHEEAAEAFAKLKEAHAADANSRAYIDYACREFFARQQCCDWRGYEAGARYVTDLAARGAHPVHPFSFLRISRSHQDQLTCARHYVDCQLPRPLPHLWAGERYRHEKIRIAYLSSDFRNHAVAHLAVGLFEEHDRDRFEIFAISFWPDDRSDVRKQIVAASDRFIDVVDHTDEAVAKLLRDLEIDIVVHLNGHTEPARLAILAQRPAPVQVNFLGYPGTVGASFVDYIVADRRVIPPEHAAGYSEKIAWLPECYQANDSRRYFPISRPSRADVGLPDRGFVFCAFNKNEKILPDIFAAWMRLLRAVDGSVLWLSVSNPAPVRNLRAQAEQAGIAPERLVFAPFCSLAEHLTRHQLADLFLDTAPYNAHTTASDALWVGVPVITLRGETFASRVAASLLHTMRLPELVTENLADYEALALKLARDSAALAGLKSRLAHARTSAPLFDTVRYCRHLEAAFIEMWTRQQRGENPQSFRVPPVE